MPREPLAVSTGSSVSESGAGDGVSLSCQLAVAPPAWAVIVTIVTVDTGLVSIGNCVTAGVRREWSSSRARSRPATSSTG